MKNQDHRRIQLAFFAAWLARAVVAAVILLGATVQVMAQAPGTARAGMPEALKGINQATGSCPRESIESSPARTAESRNAVRTKTACAITPAELDILKKEAGTVLVDVRAQRDDAVASLGEALHMPLSTVRTRAFLRDKTTVLLGSGKAERELYEACEDLVSQGYRRVRVLQGGVPHWLQAQPAKGERASPWERLTAGELWAESQFDANLVLVSPKQAELRAHLPSSPGLPALEPTAIKSVLDRWRKENKNSFLAAIVLVLGPGEDGSSLRRVQEALHPLPLLVYADTAAGYLKYQAQQKAVWEAHARGPKRPGCGL